jgi:hypothetical protein
MNPLLAHYVVSRPLWVLAKDRRNVELVALGQDWPEDSYKWVPMRAITSKRKPPPVKKGLKAWLITLDFPSEALQAEIKRLGWKLISPEGFVYV